MHQELGELLASPTFVSALHGASGADRICRDDDATLASPSSASPSPTPSSGAPSTPSTASSPPPPRGPFYERDFTQGGTVGHPPSHPNLRYAQSAHEASVLSTPTPTPTLTCTPTRTRTSTLTQVVLDPHSGHESFVPFCACAPVAMPTPFSSASTCLEHWASDPSSACQRPKASDPTTTRTAPVPSTTASEAQLEHFEKVLAAADSP